ncbi:MAG: M20/M25/M40 family metallo-hydrolase [Candidatus Lokiarchaeota archaeon]
MLTNSLKKELLKILKKLISFNTEDPLGKTKDIIDFVVNSVFKEQDGFQNRIIEYEKEGVILHNLISQIGTGNKKIVLCGHFDTVPIGYSVIFLGTADEEAGMSGSHYLRENTNIMKDTHILIIPEPTNLKIGIAEKGVIWSKILIHGKAAHGSMPNKGINAIEGAGKLIPNLKSCLNTVSNPILGKSTLNIGRIKGGSAINVVPEKVELDLDFRIIPEQDPDLLSKKLKLLDCHPCSMEVKVLVQLPALMTETNNSFIVNLKQNVNKNLIGLPYATDAAYLVDPQNPIPFIIFGPGDPERIHKIDEYVPLEQIYSCSEYLLKAIIDEFHKDK